MAKQLTIDEMLEAAQDSNLPGYQHYVRAIEGIASALAVKLAAHLDVVTDEATFQLGFGGTCAPFYAKHEGQDCPESLEPHDEGGEWETKAEHTESVLSAIETVNSDAPGRLRPYRVTLHEHKDDTHTIVFECQAENVGHAREQTINAYPDARITQFERTDL